jgi:GNAT superfamily N-acetyltransferase
MELSLLGYVTGQRRARGAVILPFPLIEAIESGLFLLPEVAEGLSRVAIPGIEGRLTPVSHPLANIVGHARLEARRGAMAIDRVMRLFAQDARAFSWRVGPASTPLELGRHLIAAGMERAESLSGMVLTDLDVSRPVPLDVRIHEASRENLAQVVDLIAQGYPAPRKLATILGSAFLHPCAQTAQVIGVYLAFVKDRSDPVAVGVSFYFPHRPIVMLGGAATLAKFRGRGIYQCLIAHRLREAKKRGVRSAVMQAVRTTSAPISRRLGFREACEIEVYTWPPTQ